MPLKKGFLTDVHLGMPKSLFHKC